MTEVFPANGLLTTLDGAHSDSVTTINIQAGVAGDFPPSGEYRMLLYNDTELGPWELVKVTGGQGTAALTVTRAAESFRGDQTAYAWSDGAFCAPVITQDGLTEYITAIAPVLVAAPPGGFLSTHLTSNTADFTTPVTILSLVLTTGWWVVSAGIHMVPNGGSSMGVEITDGTLHYGSAGGTQNGGWQMEFNIVTEAIQVTGATLTVNLVATSDAVCHACAATVKGAFPKATWMRAQRIA